LRKIIFILFSGIILISCSVTKNAGKSNLQYSSGELHKNVLESIRNQNITSENFFVQKAEIEIFTKNGKEKFIGTVKFEKPDKYLISVKSRSGIEGARIYISNDSILVNDRINKKLYSGNSLYLMRKYGIALSCIPLIFGDLVVERNFKSDQIKCTDDTLDINSLVKGVEIKYEIDCSRRKAVAIKDISNMFQQGIKVEYGNFTKIDQKLVPRLIKIVDNQYNTTIKIKIMKIESPWNGSFIFIPGKGYELIELV